jgi:hypothetical protein
MFLRTGCKEDELGPLYQTACFLSILMLWRLCHRHGGPAGRGTTDSHESFFTIRDDSQESLYFISAGGAELFTLHSGLAWFLYYDLVAYPHSLAVFVYYSLLVVVDLFFSKK